MAARSSDNVRTNLSETFKTENDFWLLIDTILLGSKIKITDIIFNKSVMLLIYPDNIEIICGSKVKREPDYVHHQHLVSPFRPSTQWTGATRVLLCKILEASPKLELTSLTPLKLRNDSGREHDIGIIDPSRKQSQRKKRSKIMSLIPDQ